jgi:hypothetical protein
MLIASTFCAQVERFQLCNEGDYRSILSGSMAKDLCLADFLADGSKEAFAGDGADVKDENVQERMIALLRPLGFEGWISRQNCGDPRLEVCVFAEFVSEVLVIQRGYVYGP